MAAMHPVHARELRTAFEQAGQGHVFRFWDHLNGDEKNALADDLRSVNVAELPRLASIARGDDADHGIPSGLEPPTVIDGAAVAKTTIDRGRALIRAGKVAALTVAGGQGTRLGFDGPKGAFCISPVRNKPLFQLFAEAILGAQRRFGGRLPWYIMTSPANDAATRRFFEQHGFFGLSRQDVSFFQQGVMPAFDSQGRILLDQRCRLALSPDGHGGTLLALARTGMLADMKARGIEHVSYFQVDNPLVRCVDPLFIGLHDEAASEMSSKTLPKADDLERVGNFAAVDGKLTVVEYSDLPEHLARSKNADGSRRFDAANIAVHVLSRTFVERLTADSASFALPWHRAGKKVPFVDLDSGARIDPSEPNAVKLESFIFDALPLADNAILLKTSREEEFAPVKNATGVDSVETARSAMNRRAARWLQQAGWTIPRRDGGEPDGRFEISPLVADDPLQFAELGYPARTVSPGDSIYVDEDFKSRH